MGLALSCVIWLAQEDDVRALANGVNDPTVRTPLRVVPFRGSRVKPVKDEVPCNRTS
jgi:hypothetical protein